MDPILVQEEEEEEEEVNVVTWNRSHFKEVSINVATVRTSMLCWGHIQRCLNLF
jgi:hypothetical protein